MNQDQPNPKKSLSEISHLFLSSVRERQTGGTSRPVRKPPAAASARVPSIDLTPEEFAGVLGESDSARPHPAPVTAVIAPHLGASSFDRVREYAGHLCSDGSRVGLIECDSSLFRLMIFERNPNPKAEFDEPVSAEGFDARRMHEALEELCWDVDRWLLVLPSPRSHEARGLLREVDHWTLLSTCDHDGVVACYRTLKGLAEVSRPKISLALLDAADEIEFERVFNKLCGVAQQFLSWPLEQEAPVCRPADIAEHLVLCCRSTRDKAQLATAPQWQLVANLLARSKAAPQVAPPQSTPPQSAPKLANPASEASMPKRNIRDEIPTAKEIVADVVIPTAEEIPEFGQPPAMPAMRAARDDGNDVIDLPEGASDPSAIISAMMRGASNQLVECPVKPPMCPDATLAVARDHRLTLVAVAKQGLADLRSIGRGYQWLIENRSLVAMALPQLSIDAHQLPRLEVLVDQADMSADILQPMLQSSNVTVMAYRKLRWAGRTGLLLNAA